MKLMCTKPWDQGNLDDGTAAARSQDAAAAADAAATNKTDYDAVTADLSNKPADAAASAALCCVEPPCGCYDDIRRHCVKQSRKHRIDNAIIPSH
jgi:hypothetical protein